MTAGRAAILDRKYGNTTGTFVWLLEPLVIKCPTNRGALAGLYREWEKVAFPKNDLSVSSNNMYCLDGILIMNPYKYILHLLTQKSYSQHPRILICLLDKDYNLKVTV